MKMRTLQICAAAFCAVVLVMVEPTSVKAAQITGSIGFGAFGVTVDNANLGLATTIVSVLAPFTDAETGTFFAVPNFTSLTFNGFVFNPPAAGVTPLWTFTSGGLTYSFNATSISSVYAGGQWDISGSGMAMITGYDDTPGTWTVNLSRSGDSFVFDASTATLVPDGGSTATLLGASFLGLVVLGGRKCFGLVS